MLFHGKKTNVIQSRGHLLLTLVPKPGAESDDHLSDVEGDELDWDEERLEKGIQQLFNEIGFVDFDRDELEQDTTVDEMEQEASPRPSTSREKRKRTPPIKKKKKVISTPLIMKWEKSKFTGLDFAQTMADVYKADNKRIDDPIKLNRENVGTGEAFTFVIGADPQFGLIARYIEKRQEEDWDQEIALFKGCIEKINKLEPKPKFFAIMGDMCDSPPTDGEEFEIRKKQEKDFFSLVDKLDEKISFVTVSGNHDVHDIPTPTTVKRYRNSWGRDFFDFVVGGVHFIVINSQYYVNSTEVSCLAAEQEEWLDNRLQQTKGSAVGPVIFMHTPPFVSNPDEPDTYFSLVKVQREKILDKFVKAGVKYVFCGHLHKNAGGKYKDLEVITTTAIGGQLGPDKSGFRVVSVTPGGDKLNVTFHTIQDS
ncbi:hypothetical protein GE061_013554 [Apolygus lucorum]|uniref:Calcineurin-like phosphoesterase domain-containing protein n=1 Tax=Apolygus lucorum TaxID=248454 RepID=A0A6A4K3J3_APOLU|nr:hypothetical protein GE061_013554 [Apolygus lucorum]